MKKNKLLSILFILFTVIQSTLAYDVVGHRIVADIAYRNLSKKARLQVDNVLGKRGIIYAASWADEIKSDKSYDYSYAWHYQNLKSNLTETELQNLFEHPQAEGEHLFLAIQSMTNRLKENKQDKEALKFLVHLIGDLHQPLHLGHSEDLGGNKISIKWFGRQINIHQVWDEMLIDSRRMSSSEYAQYLEDKFESQKDSIRKYTLFDSVKASYKMTDSIYGYDMSDTNTYHYIYRFANDEDSMIFRGGIQLANILNDIYK